MNTIEASLRPEDFGIKPIFEGGGEYNFRYITPPNDYQFDLYQTPVDLDGFEAGDDVVIPETCTRYTCDGWSLHTIEGMVMPAGVECVFIGAYKIGGQAFAVVKKDAFNRAIIPAKAIQLKHLAKATQFDAPAMVQLALPLKGI